MTMTDASDGDASGGAPADDERALTHVDGEGRVQMVDVGGKTPLRRRASAEGYFCAAPATLDRLMRGDLPKGEAVGTARIAGILAAKRCDEFIPLCHTIPLDSVEVHVERSAPDRLRITATAAVIARTGVEMEALTAVSVAALTLFDMTKAVDRALHIEGIRVTSKEKGAVTASG